jgi:hypothetical protein
LRVPSPRRKRWLALTFALIYLAACDSSPYNGQATLLQVQKFRLVDDANDGSMSNLGGGGSSGGLIVLGVILVAAATFAVIDDTSDTAPPAPRYGFVYTLQMRDGTTLKLLQPKTDAMSAPETEGFVPGALISLDHLHAGQADLSCTRPLPRDAKHPLPTLHVIGTSSCGKQLMTVPNSGQK